MSKRMNPEVRRDFLQRKLVDLLRITNLSIEKEPEDTDIIKVLLTKKLASSHFEKYLKSLSLAEENCRDARSHLVSCFRRQFPRDPNLVGLEDYVDDYY